MHLYISIDAQKCMHIDIYVYSSWSIRSAQFHWDAIQYPRQRLRTEALNCALNQFCAQIKLLTHDAITVTRRNKICTMCFPVLPDRQQYVILLQGVCLCAIYIC